MRILLSSPLHFFLSNSLILIKYTGRKTGKFYVVPARYTKENGEIYCYTAKANGWWPNLRDNNNVKLRIRGKDLNFSTKVVTEDNDWKLEALQKYLINFPADAVYHEVKLDKYRKPVLENLEKAAKNAVIVVASPN